MKNSQAPGHRNSNFARAQAAAVASLLAMLMLVGACAPARDARTITQLESARDQVHGLYDTFTGARIDEDRVKAVKSTLAALRERELAKGSTNALMAKQIEAIQDLFARHLAERRAVSRWSATHKNNKKQIIGLAFATAIATENEKNE